MFGFAFTVISCDETVEAERRERERAGWKHFCICLEQRQWALVRREDRGTFLKQCHLNRAGVRPPLRTV